MSKSLVQPEVTYPLREVAKATGIKYKKMIQLLKTYNILLKGPGNSPNPVYIKSGHFFIKEQAFQHPTIGTRTAYTTMVTAKGLDWLTHRLHEYRIGRDGEL